MNTYLFIFLSFTLTFNLCNGLPTGSGQSKTGEEGYRLPQNLIPSHYILEIQPFLIPMDFSFDGKVQILFTCFKETEKVVFHSSGLKLFENTMQLRDKNNGVYLEIKKTEYDASNDFVILHLFHTLKVNNSYKLSINYTRKINLQEQTGFYVSMYTDDRGVTRYMASTQFQPISARQAFPCFDEPAFKATFDITIVRWRNMTSVSNMPKNIIEDRGKEWEADIYETSMKMSTYLVAFIVGDYSGITDDKVTVWAPKGIRGSGRYALGASLKDLKFFEDMLDVRYEAPKLDMAAVTRLIGVAMENWGLVILDENYVLVTSQANKEEVANTIAHEIAHQWFGNLVTPKWWSDLWLNEGFAVYMQQLAFKYLYPQWAKISESLVMGSRDIFWMDCCVMGELMESNGNIFSIDCEKNADGSTIVWKNMTNKSTFVDSQLFDMAVYDKGAIIIRMVHHILGNETFWKFLNTYLEENEYGNVDEMDFWRYVERAQNTTRNIKTTMNKMTTWTHQPGLPIVTVKRDYDGTVMLSQQSCRKGPRHIRDLWQIPISYRIQGNNDETRPISVWLSEVQSTLKIPFKNEWILLNDEAADYYIVNYDRYNWQLLADQLRKDHEVFTLEQRYKLLADANNLFLLKFPGVTADILLDLSSYLQKEKEMSLFQRPNLLFIHSILPLMKGIFLEEWKEYISHIFGPYYDTLSSQHGDNIYIDDQVTPSLCNANYLPCLQNAMRTFARWKREEKLTWIGEKEKSICTAVRINKSNWKFMMDLSKDNSSGDFFKKYLFCSSNSTYIGRQLQDLKTGDFKFFEYASVLAEQEIHMSVMFDYLDKNFLSYANKEGAEANLINFIYSFNNSPVYLKKVVAIVKKHLPMLTESAQKEMKELKSKIENNLAKLDPVLNVTIQWLKGRPWRPTRP